MKNLKYLLFVGIMMFTIHAEIPRQTSMNQKRGLNSWWSGLSDQKKAGVYKAAVLSGVIATAGGVAAGMALYNENQKPSPIELREQGITATGGRIRY